jgi:large subunit ribosomal protein L25
MLANVKWEAIPRGDMTKGELKKKREEGLIPAVVSSRGKESTSLFVKLSDLQRRPYGNFTIDLEFTDNRDNITCFMKNIQFSHVGYKILHVDFQELTKGQEVDIEIPLQLVGEPVGLDKGGIVNQLIDSVLIRTLPRYLPEKFEMDISHLDVNESIDITELKLPEEISLLDPTEGTVASIIVPREEPVETEEAEEEEAETEAEAGEAEEEPEE